MMTTKQSVKSRKKRCEFRNSFPKSCNTFRFLINDLCVVKMHSQEKISIMKKITFCLMTAFILTFLIPTQFKAENEKEISSTIIGISNIIDSKALNTEINTIDLSISSQSEKKQFSSVDNQKYRANAPLSDGGKLIVFIMLIYLY